MKLLEFLGEIGQLPGPPTESLWQHEVVLGVGHAHGVSEQAASCVLVRDGKVIIFTSTKDRDDYLLLLEIDPPRGDE